MSSSSSVPRAHGSSWVANDGTAHVLHEEATASTWLPHISWSVFFLGPSAESVREIIEGRQQLTWNSVRILFRLVRRDVYQSSRWECAASAPLFHVARDG